VNSQCPGEDEEEREREVGEVDAAVGFGADAEAAEAAEPGVCAFDDPAVAGEWVAGSEHALAAAGAESCSLPGSRRFSSAAALADLGLDPTRLELLAQCAAAVAAVGPELVWPVAGGAEEVDEGEQVGALVLVAGAEPHRERPALRVHGQVVLARGKGSVERARPG
jgi:hypothetical protein